MASLLTSFVQKTVGYSKLERVFVLAPNGAERETDVSLVIKSYKRKRNS